MSENGEAAAQGESVALRYGQGSITKRTRTRKDGSVYVYYQGKFYENGEPRYFTTKTKEACYKQLKQIAAKPKKEISHDFYTVKQWLEKFIEVYKANKLAEITVKNYKATLKNHLPPELAKRKIKDVKGIELQQIISSVAAKYPRTARTLYDIFSMAFREAWNNDVIKKDITKGLKRPTVISKEEVPLTAEQQKAVFEMPDKIMRQILTAYIWSGCRLTELLTLKKEYWDKEKQTLFINGTKTATSKRTIPVFPPLRAVLESLSPDGEYLFGISEKTLKRKKAAAERQLGFKFTIKSLRHTFNQNLTEMGVSDIVRAAWMGHSKPTTTKRTYTHLTESLQKEAVKIVEEGLSGKRS